MTSSGIEPATFRLRTAPPLAACSNAEHPIMKILSVQDVHADANSARAGAEVDSKSLNIEEAAGN